jgi:Lar family restriction alleviation protein
MSNPTDLLNCPFCGGDAQTDFIEGESYLIECYACRAETGIKDSEEDAIAAWNRRAQSEGEAPQAVPDRIQSKWLREIAQDAGFNLNMRQELVVPAPHHDVEPYLRRLLKLVKVPAATLSHLCGAQHAESGKEAASEAHDELRRKFIAGITAATSLGENAVWGLARQLLGDAVAALAAQQAAAPRTDLSKRIRAAATADVTLAQAKLLIGAAEEIERAQQAAAPGALEKSARALAKKWHKDAVDNGFATSEAAIELLEVLDAAPSAPGTPEAPDTRRLALLLRSDGYRFELMNQQQHLLDPRGRIAGKGVTKRDAIDDALGIPRVAQLDGGQEGSGSNG